MQAVIQSARRERQHHAKAKNHEHRPVQVRSSRQNADDKREHKRQDCARTVRDAVDGFTKEFDKRSRSKPDNRSRRR